VASNAKPANQGQKMNRENTRHLASALLEFVALRLLQD
jgi:hypothetical protein